MGTSDRSTIITRMTILALLGAVGNFFQGISGEPSYSTPQISGGGHHKRHERFHPDIPNGKWVMKYHRHRR